MLAITVHQPMAHAILRLGKDVENRPARSPWHTAIGSTVALHAARSSAWQQHYADDIEHLTGRRITLDDVPFSAIIGTVHVDDVHWARTDAIDGDCCQPWGFADGAHVVLSRPRALADPIPCRGALGLWRLDEAAARLMQQVTA